MRDDDPGKTTTAQLSVRLARSTRDVIAAQRLRYRVFAEELGAALDSPFCGIDADEFDTYCEHLLVIDEHAQRVVGTYRVLPPAAAIALGRYYAESEFDLASFAPLAPSLAELGRSCIDPAYRSGVVLQLLWSGLARYVAAERIRFVMGCASIDARDGGGYARAVYARLLREMPPTPGIDARPRNPLPLDAAQPSEADAVELPPLIRGYRRAGASLCSAPAYDPAFRAADVLLLLDVADMAPRYARRFAPRGHRDDEPLEAAA